MHVNCAREMRLIDNLSSFRVTPELLPSLSPGKNAKMSAHAKKRKVDAECRTFKQIWTTNFFFTKVKG